MGVEMTLKMLELGLSKYIGLPEEPNIQNFVAFSNKKKHFKESLHPVTLLVQLLNTEEEMSKLNTRLRMSGFERDLGYFIIQHRKPHPHDLKFWQKTFIMTKSKSIQNTKEWIIQAIMCDDQNSDETLNAFQLWEPPRFPINGMESENTTVLVVVR